MRFKAEYRVVPQDGGGAGDGAADQWKTLTDYSGNAQMKPEIVACLAQPVYTDAVRITVLNENPVAINELYLYQADAGASLESYLSSVETALGKLTVGEYAGNVTRAAKTKLEVVLEQARAALNAGLTSREASGRWTTTVEDAVSEFYRTGYVSLDRNALYVAIDDAAALIASLDAHGLPASSTALAEARASAKQVSDAYGTVTQQDPITPRLRCGGLPTRRSRSLTRRSAIRSCWMRRSRRWRTRRRRAASANTRGSIRKAPRTLCARPSTTPRPHTVQPPETPIRWTPRRTRCARRRPRSTSQSCTSMRVALDAAKRAANGLVESQYDRAAWATMREALAAAVATDMAHISQSDVDALAARLNDAIAALSDARLDRNDLLSDAIASAQALREGDYTAESWKAFAEALAAAQEECGRRSTTQGRSGQGRKGPDSGSRRAGAQAARRR